MRWVDRFGRGARAVARFLRGKPTERDTGDASEVAPTPQPDPALRADERAVLTTLATCTLCGACDLVFPHEEIARPVFRGPSDVIVQARALAEHAALGELVKNLRRGDLNALERVCPVSIPFVALADVLERRALRLAPETAEATLETRERPRHDPG